MIKTDLCFALHGYALLERCPLLKYMTTRIITIEEVLKKCQWVDAMSKTHLPHLNLQINDFYSLDHGIRPLSDLEIYL